MTRGLKKYCPVLSCCAPDETAKLYVHRVHRSIGALKRPLKEQQGLLELLTSYQLAKSDPQVDMKDWALLWAASGALLRLARIAHRLGSAVDSQRMELVCLDAALLVAYLPEGSLHVQDFLAQAYQFFDRSETRSLLCVYRLLLVLLRIEHFRQQAMELGIVRQLHRHYCKRVLEKRPERTDPEKNAESDEKMIDDLFNAQRSIDCKSVTDVSRVNLKRLESAALCGALYSRHRQTMSLERLVPAEGGTHVHSTAGKSSLFDDPLRPSGSQASVSKLRRRKLFRFSRRSLGDETLQGMGYVLSGLGLAETISLLGNLNDTYFMQKYNALSIPEREWQLTPFLETEKEDREKLALMEIFLCISPALRHAPVAIKTELGENIAVEILNNIQSDTFSQNLLEHCVAVYVENSVSFLLEEMHHDVPCAKLTTGRKPPESVDALLDMLVREFHKLVTLRRPGDDVCHKLHLLLTVASVYLKNTPSPMEIANNLVSALDSVQKSFKESAGCVLLWTERPVQAFRSLLSFYESIFKKCTSSTDRFLLEKLLNQATKEDWMRLLRDFCETLLFRETFSWFQQIEKSEIIIETLQYLTTLFTALARLKTHIPNVQSVDLDDFGFLVAARSGLVRAILESAEFEAGIHQQVLQFDQRRWRSDVSTTEDADMIDFYLKLITTRFRELFPKASAHDSKPMSHLALYLHAITCLMKCCSSSGVTHVLESGIAELLMTEILISFQEIASPANRTAVCYTGSTTHSSPHEPTPECMRLDPVDPFGESSSSDSEREDTLVPTFDTGLPFQETPRQEEDAISESSSNDTVIFMPHPSAHRLEGTFESERRLFFEDATVDQVESELFPVDTDEALSSEAEETSSDEEWPSDLSVRGDMEEDNRRWEKYKVRKEYRQGRITFHEMRKRLACLSHGASSDDEAELGDTLHGSCSAPVPLLNFDRLKSGHSDATSGMISGQTKNLQVEESPTEAKPASGSGAAKQQIHSAVSPLELSPVHQRNGSRFSHVGAAIQAVGHLMRNDRLHLAAVEFLIEMLVLLDQYDAKTSVEITELVASISSVLFSDLNGAHFAPLVPELLELIHQRGPNAKRMLKLLLEELFEVDQYITLERIHRGEIAHVKRCALKRSGKDLPETCVVKVIDSPRDHLRSDGSILSIYSEISLMERLSNEPGFCQLYDYGIRSDSAYIVMQDCTCSLRDWVEHFPVSSHWSIRLILNIFMRIAKSVQCLHQKSIVHFDLKCSNILLRGGLLEEGFWVPSSEDPEFEILLADFGVARCYEGQDRLGTVRNRGTEVSMAPEMLLIANGAQRSVRDDEDSRFTKAGVPSDVWALGCLLFELLTGEMLYSDKNWVHFFRRVTQEMMPLFEEEKIKLLDLRIRSHVMEILRFILVRDPRRRPSITDIIAKIEGLLESDLLPRYTPQQTCVTRFPTQRHEIERIPLDKWLTHLITDGANFSLSLSRLRLCVTQFDGHLQYFRNDTLFSGIVHLSDAVPNETSNFAKGFLNGCCSRWQAEVLILPFDRNPVLRQVKRTVDQWYQTKGPEWTLCLTTARPTALPFLDLLLDIIMSVEACPCLKAISILKERIRGG